MSAIVPLWQQEAQGYRSHGDTHPEAMHQITHAQRREKDAALREAFHSSTTAKRLAELTEHDDAKVRHQALRNSNTPGYALTARAKIGMYAELRPIGMHPNSTTTALRKVFDHIRNGPAREGQLGIIRNICGHAAASERLLLDILKLYQHQVTMPIVHNDNVSSNLLRTVAETGPTPAARRVSLLRVILEHPAVDRKTLLVCWELANTAGRPLVAAHHLCWDEMDRIILSSGHEASQAALLERRPDLSKDVIAKLRVSSEALAYAVATHINAPVGKLRKLAGRKEDRIRALVAANSNTPADVLTLLAFDTDHDVAASASGHLQSRR